MQCGYCTNVHSGADLATTRANLERYALAVKRAFSPGEPMGVGLWLAAPAARALLDSDAIDDFADWLADVGLVPFTFNGFPYGDFHQPVVKHRVYEPTWRQLERIDYTRDLIDIQHRLLPEGASGSISTLPLAWGEPRWNADQLGDSADFLRQTASYLAELESETGRRIILSIEPEPGCLLQRTEDLVRYFEDHLLSSGDEEAVRRYLGVCHDVCHAAVMFEGQAETLARFRSAGIVVGKIQVSSAVIAPFDALPPAERAAALEQLAAFQEPRYLHQTMVRTSPTAAPTYYEDLPLALAAWQGRPPAGEWRTHFHVPIYLERFGHLGTSRRQVEECLAEARRYHTTEHFEIETYAWGVLPAELRQPDLAAGIAQEMAWFRQAWDRLK